MRALWHHMFIKVLSSHLCCHLSVLSLTLSLHCRVDCEQRCPLCHAQATCIWTLPPTIHCKVWPLVTARWKMACTSNMSPKKLRIPFCTRTDHTIPSVLLFRISSKLKETENHLTTYWGSTGLQPGPTTPARSGAAGGTRHPPGMGMGWNMGPHVGPLFEAHVRAGPGCEELEPSPAAAGAEGRRVTWGPEPGQVTGGWAEAVRPRHLLRAITRFLIFSCFTLYNTDTVLKSKSPSILSSSLR